MLSAIADDEHTLAFDPTVCIYNLLNNKGHVILWKVDGYKLSDVSNL